MVDDSLNKASDTVDLDNNCSSVRAVNEAIRLSTYTRISPDHLALYDDGRDGIPFDDTTLFYDTISTERGRAQMSRFPVARALCNALQLAGYNAEMDDEGEIWFEDDDCDRYHDAREYQPGPDEDDGVQANCPICRDPEKYGLGYIIRRAEAGERYITE